MYFRCTVIHESLGEAGKAKRETANYLVDAVNYTEAETRMTKVAMEYFKDFKVDKVVKTKIIEVISPEAAGIFFIVKIRHDAIDEDSGSERSFTTEYLVDADDINHAIAVATHIMDERMYAGQIISVAMTSITEVIDNSVVEVDFEERNPGEDA